MMGWVVLAAIAAVAGLALWAIGFPKRLWTIPATALTLGAAGYAWQGSPGLAGRPAVAADQTAAIDPAMVDLRERMFGRFNLAWTYFAQADAMTRIGKPASAVQAMLNATRMSQGDPAPWTGLGNALAEHDKGVSPAARFAFDRAMALHPKHPGPPFFLGLAYVRANQFAEARPWWARAVELTPPNASYRADLEMRLALLDRFLAEIAARQRGIAPAAAPEGPGEGDSTNDSPGNAQTLP